MRNNLLLAAALLATTILTFPAHAQDAMKAAPQAVKPADSPSQAVLAAWNDIGRKLIAADARPAQLRGATPPRRQRQLFFHQRRSRPEAAR
jgi:hypothetical protein